MTFFSEHFLKLNAFFELIFRAIGMIRPSCYIPEVQPKIDIFWPIHVMFEHRAEEKWSVIVKKKNDEDSVIFIVGAIIVCDLVGPYFVQPPGKFNL